MKLVTKTIRVKPHLYLINTLGDEQGWSRNFQNTNLVLEGSVPVLEPVLKPSEPSLVLELVLELGSRTNP